MQNPSALKDRSNSVTTRYRKAVKMKQLISGFYEVVRDELETAISELKKMSTVHADGYWLDVLGRRFLFQRPTKKKADAQYFGFDGNPLSTPFNTAPFKPDYGGAVDETYPVSDVLYGQLLLALIGGLRTDGTQDSWNWLLDAAYPGSYVVDLGGMEIEVFLKPPPLAADEQIVLENFANLPKPAGVTMTITLI